MTVAENKELYNKYFKVNENKSVTFMGEKLIIKITEDFLKLGIAEIIQRKILTLGIIEGYIFDNVEESDVSQCDHKFVMKIPCDILLSPSHIEPSYVYVEDIETETLKKEKAIDLVFLKGDNLLESTLIMKNIHTTDAFISMMLNGHIPNIITYEEVPLLYYNCAMMNGTGNMNSDFNALTLSTMQLTRDPKDYSVPFRLVYDEYYKKGIYNGKMIRYMDVPKYISNFTSFTTADPKHGITVAMERIYGEHQKDNKSPVEELIK